MKQPLFRHIRHTDSKYTAEPSSASQVAHVVVIECQRSICDSLCVNTEGTQSFIQQLCNQKMKKA